ncbi:MAG: RsmB/NOP family class I SAM-dependent RNA methyltransferase [Promethearchaeota archaeon]
MGIDKEEVVAKAISAIEKGASEREALKLMSEKYKITDPHIRATLHSLVFEILRRLNIIDLFIKEVLQKRTIDKLYPLLRNLLRFGVFNLKFTEKPPPKITKLIVEKARTLFGESISKFMNAMLRKIEKIKMTDLISNSTNTANLSLQYYHPKWFIDYLINLIGFPDTIQFLEKSLGQYVTYIIINALKTDLYSVTSELEQEGFTFLVDRDLPDVIRIKTWKYPIIRSRLFKEGLIYIQDKASALISHIVNPQKNEIIFDLCAAPGGKSMHIGQLMKNTGMVLSVDRSHRRLLELTSKLNQFALQNIYVINIDSEMIPEFIPLKADKVLIDPPCSGTGTFISRPYSKWKLQLKNIEMFIKIQWKLLKTAVNSVKESGEIIYSTCSITLEENELLIKKFLNKFPEFSLVPVKPFIGTPGFLGLSETQRLWPHRDDTEGFFVGKLSKPFHVRR